MKNSVHLRDGFIIFLILFMFCLGSAFGILIALTGYSKADAAFLSSFLENPYEISFISVIVSLVFFPIFAFISGFSVLGTVTVPLILLLRGFAVSVASAIILTECGFSPAFLCFFISALISDAGLFAISFASMKSAVLRLICLLSRLEPDRAFYGAFFKTAAASFSLLTIAAIIEYLAISTFI